MFLEDSSSNVVASTPDSSNFSDEKLAVSENESDQKEDSSAKEEIMDESSEIITPEGR